MVRLSREIATFIVAEYGAVEMLRRLSDPFWFQAFGCVLGFDRHSSGVTTTVCGAVKEALGGIDRELGLYAAGGKGGRCDTTLTTMRLTNVFFMETSLDFRSLGRRRGSASFSP
jgi:hypothetical protein